MAEETQNGVGIVNGSKVSPVVFTAMKPWLVVEAPKANDAVQFYKAAFGAEEVNRVNHPKRKMKGGNSKADSKKGDNRLNSSLDRRLLLCLTSTKTYLLRSSEVGYSSSNLWLAQDPSKRWGEIFFLLYTPFWLTLCLGIVVPYKLYEMVIWMQLWMATGRFR